VIKKLLSFPINAHSKSNVASFRTCNIKTLSTVSLNFVNFFMKQNYMISLSYIVKKPGKNFMQNRVPFGDFLTFE